MSREGLSPNLPILFTKGSHFDVGYATGTTFADRIRRYMQDDETARALYESRDGRDLCDVLKRKGEDNFPQYATEIHGLAAGVGVSYEDMLLHNLTLDILCMDDDFVLDLLGSVGFSVNIADVKSPDVLWSAEVQPGLLGNRVHMHPVVEAAFSDLEDKGCYFQTNTYQHLPNSKIFYFHLQRPLARSNRAKEMFPCADENNYLEIRDLSPWKRES